MAPSTQVLAFVLCLMILAVCIAQKRHLHIRQRMDNLEKLTSEEFCTKILSMAPGFWASNRFSQCIPVERNNGVQQFALQLDLDKLEVEQQTYDPFVLEWLVVRMLNNYTGNCQTTAESKRKPFDASNSAIILTGPENEGLCDTLIGHDAGLGEVIRCAPRQVTKPQKVQGVTLTSYLINVDAYIDKWDAFEFNEQLNRGLDLCRYNAYPLKPE